jgi:O-succinylhomoserine sulfhydrylase
MSTTFDAVLRVAIANRGLSLSRLHARLRDRGLDVSLASLSNWQRGKCRPEPAKSLAAVRANLGDAKSLVTHPSTTTHQRLSEAARREQGITQGLLRLSVGLEDVDDLADDLDQALAKLG